MLTAAPLTAAEAWSGLGVRGQVTGRGGAHSGMLLACGKRNLATSPHGWTWRLLHKTVEHVITGPAVSAWEGRS